MFLQVPTGTIKSSIGKKLKNTPSVYLYLYILHIYISIYLSLLTYEETIGNKLTELANSLACQKHLLRNLGRERERERINLRKITKIVPLVSLDLNYVPIILILMILTITSAFDIN